MDIFGEAGVESGGEGNTMLEADATRRQAQRTFGGDMDGVGRESAYLAHQGAALFGSLGCSGCHDARSTIHAPLLDGIYGRATHLQDGHTVVADANYLRDSILVQTDDAVLLAHKSQAQKVKELVKKLSEDKKYKKLV